MLPWLHSFLVWIHMAERETLKAILHSNLLSFPYRLKKQTSGLSYLRTEPEDLLKKLLLNDSHYETQEPGHLR